MGHGGIQAANGLAKPDQQEGWTALVLIATRKHRSPRPRAFRWESETTRTGDAAEVKVTSFDIKASRRRK